MGTNFYGKKMINKFHMYPTPIDVKIEYTIIQH